MIRFMRSRPPPIHSWNPSAEGVFTQPGSETDEASAVGGHPSCTRKRSLLRSVLRPLGSRLNQVHRVMATGWPSASQTAWIFLRVCGRWLALAPPCSSGGRAMRLGRRGVDAVEVARRDLAQSLKQVPPDGAPRPAVVERGGGTVVGRTIAPATARLEHVDDAAQHAPV